MSNENTEKKTAECPVGSRPLLSKGLVFMYCSDCGKKLTQAEIDRNERIAKNTGTPRLDMCSSSWAAYCDHAITGR